MKAIVFDGGLKVVDDVSVREPGPDEVLVRIQAAGLCHSDMSVVDGTIPYPTPVVLGHEGAGVVEAVGPAVKTVKVGDHVCLTTLGNCGACAQCESGYPTMCRRSFGARSKPFTWNDAPAYSFANTSVFAERTVVRFNQAVPIPKDIPLTSAALIGCGVLTGVGAVLHRANVRRGSSVVVFGVGGIGLNVIQGARIAGALQIVAVDTNPAKEDVAKIFGATSFIDVSGKDSVGAIKEVLPEGADYSFECVGHPAVIRAAIDVLGWAGTCVVLGVPPATAEATFHVASMYLDKTIMGCRYGSSQPAHDIPLYVDLYQTGQLKLDELVTKTYTLDDVDKAVDDMHAGVLARGVFTLS